MGRSRGVALVTGAFICLRLSHAIVHRAVDAPADVGADVSARPHGQRSGGANPWEHRGRDAPPVHPEEVVVPPPRETTTAAPAAPEPIGRTQKNKRHHGDAMQKKLDPSAFNMRVVDAEMRQDYDSTMEHARNMSDVPMPDLDLIFHTFWRGQLSRKHLLSIQSCYYQNVLRVGGDASRRREIVLWTDDPKRLEEESPPGLVETVRRYATIKKASLDHEIAGTPIEGHFLGADQVRPDFYTDKLRLLLLYNYAGVYFDLDVIWLRAVDPILRDYPDQVLAYAWKFEPYPNNAFMYSPSVRHKDLTGLFNHIVRMDCPMFGFQACHIAYTADIGLTVLPATWFDAGWYFSREPERISTQRFFEKTKVNVTWDGFYQGSFGFHWHNQWNDVLQVGSPFQQLEAKLPILLSSPPMFPRSA